MKPFSDLACEMRDGLPWCPDGPDTKDRDCDDYCGRTILNFSGPACDRGNLCLLAVRRFAQVFEAARSERMNALHSAEERWAIVSDALRAVNANVEE